MTAGLSAIVAPVRTRVGDRVFRRLTIGAGISILVALAAVAVFLVAQSIPALVADPSDLRGEPSSFWEYVAPLAFGTVWAAAGAPNAVFEASPDALKKAAGAAVAALS